MMKKILIAIILLSPTIKIYGQQFEWSNALWGPEYDHAYGLTATQDNGCVITLSFSDSIDADPGLGFTYLTTTDTNDYSILISKYDSTGNLQWHDVMVGDFLYAGTIVTDDNGNLYLAGTFKDSITFRNSQTVYYGNCSRDIFFAKYSSIGNLIWAKVISSPTAISSNNTAYLAKGPIEDKIVLYGSFENTIDVDPSPATNIITSGSNRDMFLSYYDTAGTFLHSSVMPLLSGSLTISSAYMDPSGKTALCGEFYGTIDFDPGSGSSTLNNPQVYNNIYVATYDSLGNLIWCFQVGGNFNDEPRTICADPNFNIYLCGRYNTSIDLNPGPSTATLSGGNSFIASYNNFGSLTWYTGDQGPSGAASIMDIAYSNGDIVYGGQYSGNVLLGSTTLVNNWINPIAMFGTVSSTNGAFTSAYSFSVTSPIDSGTSTTNKFVAIAPNSSIYLSGEFSGSVDVNPDTLSSFDITATDHRPWLIDPRDNYTAKYSFASIILSDTGRAIESGLSIYPNPADKVITIKSDGDIITTLTITNSVGSAINQMSNDDANSELNIDVSNLSQGCYFILAISNSGQTQCLKLIVNH